MKKVKYKRKIKKVNVIILIVVMVIIMVLLFFKLINNKVGPIFMSVAESESKKFATLIINDAINKNVDRKLTEELLLTTKDDDNNISSIEFNTSVVNQTLTVITNNVLLNLKHIEDGDIETLKISDEIVDTYKKENLEHGIIYRIPMGIIFNNSILNNIGPKIPVKLNFIGDIESNIKTKTRNYGINNVLIEVYVTLKVDIKVILPMQSSLTEVKSTVPIVIKSIQGSVPNFYSKNGNESFSLPIE